MEEVLSRGEEEAEGRAVTTIELCPKQSASCTAQETTQGVSTPPTGPPDSR